MEPIDDVALLSPNQLLAHNLLTTGRHPREQAAPADRERHVERNFVIPEPTGIVPAPEEESPPSDWDTDEYRDWEPECEDLAYMEAYRTEYEVE